MEWKRKVASLLIGVLGVCISATQVEAGVPVTSPFGWRIHPIYGGTRFHTGADIGFEGGTEVLAMLPGEVEFADWWSGYGKCVILKHEGGDHTLYGHMDTIDVKKGDPVVRGSVLGTVGQTGVATGPHLHLEYWKNGQYVDPLVLYGMTGTSSTMLPDGAIMPVYTMGGQVSPAVQSPNISRGVSNIQTANQHWQEPISFVFDSDRQAQRMQEEHLRNINNNFNNSGKMLGPKKNVKNFVEQEKEEIHAKDLLRDAARRRRLGKSNPYYGRANVEERAILDSIVSKLMGVKPYQGAFEAFADKVSEQVADTVTGTKSNKNKNKNAPQIQNNTKNGFNEPAKQQAQKNNGFNL